MNKKTIALFLGAVTALAVPAVAQTPAPAAAPAVTVSLTPAFVSEYMFRGSRLGGLSFQPTVEVAAGNLGIGVWANFPIDDKVAGVSDPELDPYVYYMVKLSDNLTVVPGATLYTYPSADQSLGFYRTTFEPNIAINYTVNGFKITPKLYYDFVLDGPTAELTGAYSVPVAAIGSSLDFVATYGTFKWKNAVQDSVPETKAWGNYWLIGVSAPFQLTPTSKIVAGYAYTKGDDQFFKAGTTPKVANSLATGKGVVSVSYSITF